MNKVFGVAPLLIIPHILGPNRIWVLTVTMLLEFIRK